VRQVGYLQRLHISDCVETVHKSLLLPNNIERNIFTQIGSSKMCWIFINGALVWQWLDKYVTVDKMFYNARYKPLTQVSKRETDEHTLPSTNAVTVFL
jgi:hypothetical protein